MCPPGGGVVVSARLLEWVDAPPISPYPCWPWPDSSEGTDRPPAAAGPTPPGPWSGGAASPWSVGGLVDWTDPAYDHSPLSAWYARSSCL